jgi:hypothetical protein
LVGFKKDEEGDDKDDNQEGDQEGFASIPKSLT